MENKKQEEVEFFLKNFGGKEDFYLDPLELLNKPRRMFTGLKIRLYKSFKKGGCSEKDFLKVEQLLKLMSEDFYKNKKYIKFID